MSLLEVVLAIAVGVVLAALVSWLIVAGAARHVRRGRHPDGPTRTKRHHDA